MVVLDAYRVRLAIGIGAEVHRLADPVGVDGQREGGVGVHGVAVHDELDVADASALACIHAPEVQIAGRAGEHHRLFAVHRFRRAATITTHPYRVGAGAHAARAPEHAVAGGRVRIPERVRAAARGGGLEARVLEQLQRLAHRDYLTVEPVREDRVD